MPTEQQPPKLREIGLLLQRNEPARTASREDHCSDATLREVAVIGLIPMRICYVMSEKHQL